MNNVEDNVTALNKFCFHINKELVSNIALFMKNNNNISLITTYDRLDKFIKNDKSFTQRIIYIQTKKQLNKDYIFVSEKDYQFLKSLSYINEFNFFLSFNFDIKRKIIDYIELMKNI